jgi:hypothetical protein
VEGDGDLGDALADDSPSGVSTWSSSAATGRKIDGAWLIAHDQISVPLDVPSGEGVVDLEP